MKLVQRLANQREGFTLVEMLISMAILVMAIAMALSVLVAMQAGSVAASSWGDRSQVLRAAMNQISDDLTYATGDGSQATLGQCCSGGGHTFSVYVYESRTNKAGWHTDWTDTEEWPGWIQSARTLWVTYRIQDGSLVRIVHDPGDPDFARIYVQQVLATDLDPTRCEFVVDPATNMISVSLGTVETEGASHAEVSAQWHVRQIRKQ